MKDRCISLNGEWYVEYISDEAYESREEPKLSEEKIKVQNAVPNYFEDMRDVLSNAPFFHKIKINPLYKRQTYPETGYCEDTVLPTYLGSFAYCREIELERLCGDLSLFVGGVQNRLSLWINGKYIGTHLGYSTDFELNIPSDILKIGKNRFTLAVSNNRLMGYDSRPVSGLTSRAANECTGGIYGDVELRINNSGLRDVWISTSPDLSHITVNLDAKRGRGYLVKLLDGENTVMEKVCPDNCTDVEFSSDGLEFWSPDSPKLYTALVLLDGETLLRRDFGIRRLTVDGTKLVLNGKPYFFRGFCEHCYHPITVHPARDEKYYEKVISHAKELGFNSIRFHTYVPPVEYMAAADRLGMLIEVETPNNTSIDEWNDIVRMTRRYTCVVAYSSGNEMVIDEDYIEHLRRAATIVHGGSDSLFSPMSAMRGVEYHSYGDCRVDEPFHHNPKRLKALGEFCDVYNTYSLGLTSYTSASGDAKTLDCRNSIYKKPLLTHEICIHGTYCDLSVEKRYEGTRIGETEMFSSVREHLTERGLIDRWELYFKNSVAWQKLLRKHCFELVRRAESFAGYDFLGDIDTHWHTFGYSVGLMNEFYEMKPGETVKNVKRYNSDNVLLCDLPNPPIFGAGEEVTVPVLISSYGNDINDATLSVTLSCKEKKLISESKAVGKVKSGGIRELLQFKIELPKSDFPEEFTLSAELTSDKDCIENEWKLYAFPTVKEAPKKPHRAVVSEEMSEEELLCRLKNGERVVIFGAKPFEHEATSFQISLAGRTNGHLATVVRDHPITEKIMHFENFGWHFKPILNNGKAVMLDVPSLPFEPIIEIATSYKNAHREGLLFEYAVGSGRLIVCSLNLENAVGRWLKNEIISYAQSDHFTPKIALTSEELSSLINCKSKKSEANTNFAFNKNDITAN